jgi:very-short-patch-repair endonuclease
MKTEEGRQYMSALRTGVSFAEEHCRNISESKKGKSNGPHSEETKNKIGQTNKETSQRKKEQGYVRPEYKMSSEALERASERMKGNTLGKNGHHNKGKTLDLTVEQRKNRSAKRVAYLSNSKGVKSGTKPELKFIEFLVEHNINYEHQHPVHTSNGSWLYDFWLPDLNLLIEIDGEFWHSTKQSIRRDKIKNNIAKSLNKTLARISTDNIDFSVIFLSVDEIWQRNNCIINKRKEKHG